MILFPHAKINIGLNITGKRTDGYHNIQSVFYPVLLKDTIEIVPAPTLQFRSGGLPIPGDPKQNLVIKAWELLKENHGIGPVKIFLDKRIPMGAGLGGGSSDAAFALKIMNQLFGLELTQQQMHEYSVQLGADCSFFMMDMPAYATETGTTLEEIPVYLTKYWMLLVLPGIHIDTAEAYSGITIGTPAIDLKKAILESIDTWTDNISNDFEGYAFQKHPELKEIKEKLYQAGAVYASMTGSGSAMYGIFREPPHQVQTGKPQLVMKMGLP